MQRTIKHAINMFLTNSCWIFNSDVSLIQNLPSVLGVPGKHLKEVTRHLYDVDDLWYCCLIKQ